MIGWLRARRRKPYEPSTEPEEASWEIFFNFQAGSEAEAHEIFSEFTNAIFELVDMGGYSGGLTKMPEQEELWALREVRYWAQALTSKNPYRRKEAVRQLRRAIAESYSAAETRTAKPKPSPN